MGDGRKAWERRLERREIVEAPLQTPGQRGSGRARWEHELADEINAQPPADEVAAESARTAWGDVQPPQRPKNDGRWA